jgi:hypothetical protein
MFRLKLTIYPLLVLAILASTMAAQAATYYVATTGSDSNSGTEASPWRTVKNAVDTMLAGDTTFVRGGTYNEGYIWFKRSGTEASPIRLLNYPGESPKIQWSDMTVATNRIELLASPGGITTPVSDIVIEGFEITGGQNGIKLNAALRVTIRKNYIHHNGHGIIGNGFHVLITQNRIYHNGNFANCASNPASCNDDHGMYLTGTFFTITNNLIYDNLAYGIQTAGYPFVSGQFPSADYANFKNAVIANNTIAYQNHRSAIVLWQAGTSDNTIENNIMYENAQLAGASSNGIDCESPGNNNVVKKNLFYATAPGGTAATAACSGSNITVSGSITTGPLFVNGPATIPASPDFHLQATSPAIDIGAFQLIITLPAPPINLRVQ